MYKAESEGNMLFSEYYANWIALYKEGAVREVTLKKYKAALAHIQRLTAGMDISDMNRTAYQKLLNEYAKTHEKQTVTDFHHMVKPCLLDARDEGLLQADPTRRVTIKGKPAKDKKIKYLNQYDLHKLLDTLTLDNNHKYDWLLYLGAKTGVRLSEALGVTPADFDMSTQSLSINKTYDYKNGGGFVATKNKSSMRKIQLDWQTMNKFYGFIKDKDPSLPIFVNPGERIYDSTINDILARHCKAAHIAPITYHGLRHTHASVLLFSGVSVPSVSRRLGHSSIATTQKVYLHIIKEMDNFDNDIIMKTLVSLE